MNMTLQIVRLVAVIALLCAVAAIVTPKGRLPLALRGVMKIMRRDRPENFSLSAGTYETISGRKRLLAFFLVLVAILVCLI